MDRVRAGCQATGQVGQQLTGGGLVRIEEPIDEDELSGGLC